MLSERSWKQRPSPSLQSGWMLLFGAAVGQMVQTDVLATQEVQQNRCQGPGLGKPLGQSRSNTHKQNLHYYLTTKEKQEPDWKCWNSFSNARHISRAGLLEIAHPYKSRIAEREMWGCLWDFWEARLPAWACLFPFHREVHSCSTPEQWAQLPWSCIVCNSKQFTSQRKCLRAKLRTGEA